VRATERVARVIGILPSVAFRAARAMREVDPALWPSAEKGGGHGAAHVELPHLVNLVLALAASDTVTQAPKVAAGWRGMVWNTVPNIPPDLTGHATGILTNAGLFREDITAGEFLEDVVKLLANRDDASQVLRSVGFRVVLEHDSRWPRMSVSYTESDLLDDEAHHQPKFIFRPRQTPVGLSRKLDPAWNFLEPAGEQYILKSTTFQVALFELLLDLWNDTRHHTKTVPSRTPPGAPASANPERETAAAPGRESAAARRLTQPPAAEQPRTTEPSHSSNRSGERKRRQPFSAGAGQSCNEETPDAHSPDAAVS
jgi:hypothetical protein